MEVGLRKKMWKELASLKNIHHWLECTPKAYNESYYNIMLQKIFHLFHIIGSYMSLICRSRCRQHIRNIKSKAATTCVTADHSLISGHTGIPYFLVFVVNELCSGQWNTGGSDVHRLVREDPVGNFKILGHRDPPERKSLVPYTTVWSRVAQEICYPGKHALEIMWMRNRFFIWKFRTYLLIQQPGCQGCSHLMVWIYYLVCCHICSFLLTSRGKSWITWYWLWDIHFDFCFIYLDSTLFK